MDWKRPESIEDMEKSILEDHYSLVSQRFYDKEKELVYFVQIEPFKETLEHKQWDVRSSFLNLQEFKEKCGMKLTIMERLGLIFFK